MGYCRAGKRRSEKESSELKKHTGKDILVGSPSLIVSLMALNLIDELQLCIHPVIAGSGLPLFKTVYDKPVFKLINTKIFTSGAVIHYYEPTK
jgi:dihydrofolate reductase